MEDRIGSYALGPLLGEGAMARVYRATGPDGGAVALKLARTTDAVARRRFAREVRAVLGVQEPHVVPVLDAGEHDGVPYLVQPLLAGGTLRDRLAGGPLPMQALGRVSTHVARGLGALHARGIVHRDVKPANILFDADDRAHVADFGLVKERDASLLTRPGQQVGTLDYMAPEQIRGEEPTAATDVYALGCVAYECATGVRVFGDRESMDAMFAHLHDPPPDPRTLRPDLPAGAAAVIGHALAKAPGERPPTARAFAKLLGAGLR